MPVLGPLGRGFSIASGRRHLLLIGAGWGVASLIGLAHEAIARGTEVTIVGEFQTAAEALPAWLVPAEAEYLLAIQDGAGGGEQSVVELAEQAWRWADQVFVAGSMELLAKVAQIRRAAVVRIPAQGLFEAQMGCGVGICLSCVVETRRGYKLACVDGPTFRLEEVFGP